MEGILFAFCIFVTKNHPNVVFFFFFNKILPVWFYEKDYAIPTKPEHVSSTLSVIGEDFFQASVRLYDYMCIGQFVTFSTKTLISPLIIFSAIRIWQKLSNNFN